MRWPKKCIINNRDTPDEKQIKAAKRQNRDLARILLAATAEPRTRHRQLRQLTSEDRRPEGRARNGGRRPLGRKRCACCEEEGPWARDGPKRGPKVNVSVEDDDYRGRGAAPRPEPRVTPKVEEKPPQFS